MPQEELFRIINRNKELAASIKSNTIINNDYQDEIDKLPKISVKNIAGIITTNKPALRLHRIKIPYINHILTRVPGLISNREHNRPARSTVQHKTPWQRAEEMSRPTPWKSAELRIP